MAKRLTDIRHARRGLSKCPTGVIGLDQITQGGLPRGRPTLVCGGPGCGKTLFAIEFLVRGAMQFDEPGVLMSFEESAEELAQNVRSLGFDLEQLIKQKKIAIDHVRVERSEIEEAGEYDLEGLFIRLGYAIDSIGAKRVVLDTVEALFGGVTNHGVLRSELRRLFQWLKDKGVTAVITAERGEATLTRQGLEEYVSDCVIVLDQRVIDQVSTRRLRVVKYRGTAHGTNEYPFLIDADGFSVLPITALGLEHEVSDERISSGIPRLDAMLGGAGVYRGTSVLISGTSGTGKSSLAAHFADTSCKRGERCLYFAFEESPQQIVRNMRSIGLDLEPWIQKGTLKVVAGRPTLNGLEMHLAIMHKHIQELGPRMVVVDPISNLRDAGTLRDSTSMLVRMIDFMKSEKITGIFTCLTAGRSALEATELDILSIIDTWLVLRDIELGGERNRVMHVLKSRGTAHSNQIREFLLTSRGVDLKDVYLGPDGVLTGSTREMQEARERSAQHGRQLTLESGRRALAHKRKALEAQIEMLQMQLEVEASTAAAALSEDSGLAARDTHDQESLARSRRADLKPHPRSASKRKENT
jgi:circadian clock protein KaiC